MNYVALSKIYNATRRHRIQYWLLALGVLFLLFLILPWTQNVKGKGKITALYQEQRPQQINAPIPGRITRWLVKNGDFVRRGDTLLQISEIKEDYWDPLLVQRGEEQLQAKKSLNQNVQAKINTTEAQLQALNAARDLKIAQLKIKLSQYNNKLQAEEAELKAARNEMKLIEDQYNRQKKMYDEGLVSLTQFQQRTASYQNAVAKQISAENKLAQTRQELTAITVEQSAVLQEYSEKISKAQGDVFQSRGYVEANKGDIAKLENQVANYKVRQGMYYIVAMQDGQIVQLNKAGIGEVLKEGENIGTIVPTDVQYAVALNIAPVDLPLIHEGQKVMCVFDGFPAIIFSGWPNSSYGLFRGKVFALESNISEDGYFRAIIVEDKSYRPWPPKIKMGTGVQGIAMLKDVPMAYEIWRRINGFPPDYYNSTTSPKGDAKK